MHLFWENLIEVSIKIIPILVAALVGFLFGVLKDHKNTIFNKKLAVYSQIISSINKHEYMTENFNKMDLIDLFAPARLLGSRKLEFYLREYYALVVEYLHIDEISARETKSDEISEVVMNIEQIMREELGNRRTLSAKEIFKHVYR
ncbi:hypothetical protein HY311_01190 [Candidatus Nomurabacteria bacterium]|nr:hypothetical protein [Candidatus Nomurabacteria bacterium]